MTDIALPPYVLTALDRLESRGYSAYAVGGCVRDSLLGRIVNDYDVCTSALPQQTIDAFSEFHTIETGLKHGTVTVRIDHHPIEITTFRTEGDYSDGRHPDAVNFTSDIVCDLSRRDFTVNAMAYSPSRGLIDPFCAQRDLSDKIIKCVGDPHKRFSEDALRILRAIRFASVLGFNIERETSKAISDLKHRLSIVSRERIRDEFFKLICGMNMSKVMTDYKYVISEFIPEMIPCLNFDQNNPHHDHDLYTHLVLTAVNLPNDPVLRLAGLIHDIEKPNCVSIDANGIAHYYSHAEKSAETAKNIAHSLRCSNAETQRISKLIKYHDGVIDESDKAVKRRLNQLGEKGLYDLLDLQKADNLAQKNEIPRDRLIHNEALRSIAKRLIDEDTCVNTNSLKLDGKDMILLGFKGRQIGKALSILLDSVMNNEVENEEKALLDFINSRRDEIISNDP